MSNDTANYDHTGSGFKKVGSPNIYSKESEKAPQTTINKMEEQRSELPVRINENPQNLPNGMDKGFKSVETDLRSRTFSPVEKTRDEIHPFVPKGRKKNG